MQVSPSARLFSGLLLTAVLLLLPSYVRAAERILDFGAAIEVLPDARVIVTETIQYDFETSERHGIFRDIPTEFVDTSGEAHNLLLSVESVVDEHGRAYQWLLEPKRDLYHIRIGDPDRTISGAHTFVITYSVMNAIVTLPDRNEVYWNVTGNNWQVPIGSAHASVTLPPAVLDNGGEAKITRACYRGGVGSLLTCPATGMQNRSEFTSATALGPYEGITVAVGFPRGIVIQSPQTFFQEILLWLTRYADLILAFLIPLLVGGFAFRQWHTKGRDPKGRGVIVPEYEAPENLSILEAAYLLNTNVKQTNISATVIALAVKGALTIEEVNTKILLVFNKKDYRLKKTGNVESLLPDERQLHETLFWPVVGSADNERLVSDIEPLKMQSTFQDLQKEIGKSLTEKNLFSRNPIKLSYYTPTLLSILAPVFILFVLTYSLHFFYAWFGLGLALIMALVTLRLMPQMTKEGVVIREKLLGLKRYIEVAEKDRIEFHNAPERTPELFEKLLPYAMLFGLTAIWVSEFADLMKNPPSWYSSPSGTWVPVAFASDLDAFSSSFVSAASPSQSASGGGGSSGGGGGGGGGGSW